MTERLSPAQPRREFRRVCVFCGSNAGRDRAYHDAARDLGATLAARGIGLVWGGGQVGLMGLVADAALAAGAAVTGVIPRRLATKELLHTKATQMHVVDSMHARKALMAELSDAFIALPGGFGTLEETLEVITWGQLGIHAKPVGLLDTLGFYGPLVEFIDHAIAHGFIRAEQRALFVTAPTPSELLDRLATHDLPNVRKWITPNEV